VKPPMIKLKPKHKIGFDFGKKKVYELERIKRFAKIGKSKKRRNSTLKTNR